MITGSPAKLSMFNRNPTCLRNSPPRGWAGAINTNAQRAVVAVVGANIEISVVMAKNNSDTQVTIATIVIHWLNGGIRSCQRY